MNELLDAYAAAEAIEVGDTPEFNAAWDRFIEAVAALGYGMHRLNDREVVEYNKDTDLITVW